MISNKNNTSYVLFIGFIACLLLACDDKPQETLQTPATDPEALYQLAQGYLTTGKGKNDVDQAIHILNQLAEKGYVLAINKLGFLYSQGAHVEKDLSQAYHWYSKAAEAGFAISQYNLAEMQRFGLGTEKNEKSAYNWYQKSALQGYPSAMLRVAEAYTSSVGVEKDLSKAYAWYQVAIDNGVNLPKSIQNGIASKLSEKQQSEANKHIADLKWKLSVKE